MVFNVQPFWNVDLTSHPWRSNCQASWRRFPSIPRRIGVITLIFVNVPKQKVVEVLKWKRCFGKNMSNGTWSIWTCSLPCSSPFCRSGISMVAVTSANSHGAQRTPSSAGMIDMSKELPTCFQVPALTLSFWMCWLTQRAEMEVKPWNRCQHHRPVPMNWSKPCRLNILFFSEVETIFRETACWWKRKVISFYVCLHVAWFIPLNGWLVLLNHAEPPSWFT